MATEAERVVCVLPGEELFVLEIGGWIEMKVKFFVHRRREWHVDGASDIWFDWWDGSRDTGWEFCQYLLRNKS